MSKLLKKITLYALIFLPVLIIVTGCKQENTDRPAVSFREFTPTPVVPTVTPRPTYTPTPAPLGDPENPIVMAIINEPGTQTQIDALDQLATLLEDNLKLEIEAKVFSDYAEFEKEAVHIAFLEPVAYLLASEDNTFEIGLLTNQFGVTFYGVQFLAHKDSNFTRYFDANNNTSTADAATALAQFSGAVPCLTDNNALASYWVPLGLLKGSSVVINDPVLTNSNSASIRAIYIKGICDFAATYAISGDPRTASSITTDLPDVMDNVVVIWQSEGIIPYINISFSKIVDFSLRKQFEEIFKSLALSPSGLDLLSRATSYPIQALQSSQDSAYDTLRNLLKNQDVRLENILGK